MDKYLFENFITGLYGNAFKGLCYQIIEEAQKVVEFKNRVYFNYFPDKNPGIQLVLDTIKNSNKIVVKNLFFHHTSSSIWKIKIIKPLNNYPCTYTASKVDEDGIIIIRLVNEEVLGKEIKSGDIIEVQVSAFAGFGNIYKSNEDYENDIPYSEDGNKYMLDEGILMPIRLLLDNYKIDDEENKFLNNMVACRGKIIKGKEYDLKINDIELPKYFNAIIDTEFGQLPIFFTEDFVSEDVDGFGVGNVIGGEFFLSGDVCINEYNKYVKNNDLNYKG